MICDVFTLISLTNIFSVEFESGLFKIVSGSELCSSCPNCARILPIRLYLSLLIDNKTGLSSLKFNDSELERISPTVSVNRAGGIPDLMSGLPGLVSSNTVGKSRCHGIFFTRICW